MHQEVKENVFLMNEQEENLSKKESPVDGLNIKMAMTERISELEDWVIKIIQSEEQTKW